MRIYLAEINKGEITVYPKRLLALALTGLNQREDFKRNEKISGCVLTKDADDHSLKNRQLIELKAKRVGSFLSNSEEYTLKNHKIYSFRNSLEDPNAIRRSNATLYTGSGMRESLGTVNMEILMQ